MRGRDRSGPVARARAAVVGATAAAVGLSVALALCLASNSARTERGADAAGRDTRRFATLAIEREAGTAAGDAVVEAEVAVGGAPVGRSVTKRFVVDGGRAQVDLGEGGAGRAYLRSARGVVWPRSAPIAAGATATFHVEPLRAVSLRAAEFDAPGAGGEIEGRARTRVRFVPDRRVVPEGPSERIDALQAWIDTESVAVAVERGDPVARVPRGTAWWVLAQTARGPSITHLDAAPTSADVLTIDPRGARVLDRAPTCGGASLPEGTLVAPGRLDAFAAAEVRAAVRDLGFAGAVLTTDGPWRAVALPSADVLTLAHPTFGVAYASWEALQAPGAPPPDGRPEPGAIEFVATDGAEFSLGVAVWPSWPGTGEVFSRPSDRMLRTLATGRASHVVRGLPAGVYRFDYAAAEGARRPGRDLRRGEVRVDAALPRPRVEVTVRTD